MKGYVNVNKQPNIYLFIYAWYKRATVERENAPSMSTSLLAPRSTIVQALGFSHWSMKVKNLMEINRKLYHLICKSPKHVHKYRHTQRDIYIKREVNGQEKKEEEREGSESLPWSQLTRRQSF